MQLKNNLGPGRIIWVAGCVLLAGCQRQPADSTVGKSSKISPVPDVGNVECCGRCQEEACAEGEACCQSTGGSQCEACQREGTQAGNTEADMAAQEQNAAAPSGAMDEQPSSAPLSLAEDRDVFHFLLQNHAKIQREVEMLDNGVRTVTQSRNPVVAAQIKKHVQSMKRRVEEIRPLRRWDQLFRAVFENAAKIKMSVEETPEGVVVVETSSNPFAARLIQAHADVVTQFVKRGFAEARRNHAPPEQDETR